MATRNPNVAVAGTKALAADANSWAKGWVAWRTRDFGGNVPITEAAGETEITTLTVTPTLVAGRRYKITGQVRFDPATAAPIQTVLKLYAGALQIDSHTWITHTGDTDGRMSVCAVLLAASSAAMTFKMTAHCVTAASQFNLNNTAYTLGIMLIEDIGVG